MKTFLRIWLPAGCLLIAFSSCEDSYTPKPRGYARIMLPEKIYRPFSSPCCPFAFSYPSYASIESNASFFDTIPEHPCWLNIRFDTIQAKIHFSYKRITEEKPLARLLEDSRLLTFKHTVRAAYIDEVPLHRTGKVDGILYEVGGNAASSLQFYLTDSQRHFLRGALYFNTTPNADSLRPVLDFVRRDIYELINTFSWSERTPDDSCRMSDGHAN